MLKNRVIPTLLLKNGGLVKTTCFKKPVYIGDPINAVRIFNDKEVDELILLEISATVEKKEPEYHKIKEIVEEAFMPIGYGGGIKSIEQIEQLFRIGIEKVVINSSAYSDEQLIRESAKIFGSQSIVLSIDVKKNIFGQYLLFSHSGSKKQKKDIVSYVHKMQEYGVGEIILNSIDRDGTMKGYDLSLIKAITHGLEIPLIASGGAGEIKHFVEAIKHGASAVAAGAMFVFQGVHRAVLISYIDKKIFEEQLTDE